jgi:hypothetical protein
MQQLDCQQHMTSAASWHTTNSYWYYSPIYFVLGPMQASRCAAWHLREASTFWRLTFEYFKLYTPELNSLKDLIRESGATPNRCTYTVPLFNQLDQKALSDFLPEYLVPEIEYSANLSQTRNIQITQHLLTCQACRGYWWGLVPRIPDSRMSLDLTRGTA